MSGGTESPRAGEPSVVMAEEVTWERPERLTPEQPPVRWRELLAVVLLVVLADVALYRAYGFAGYAVFCAVAPLLLCLGSPRPRLADGFWLLGVLLAVLAARMFWSGSWLLVGCGAWLLVALAMTLSGLRPYVLETGVFASQSILAGYEGLVHYRHSSDRLGPVANRGIGLDVVLPLVALVAFGLLFIVANPDLLRAFGETIQSMLDTLRDWILGVSPTWQEVALWAAVLWVSVGLLRPVIGGALAKEPAEDATRRSAAAASGPAPLYAPFRNTLITVIVLFAVYLVFEFATLWGHEFPKGFYYSGYAHEGAAWLTVALATGDRHALAHLPRPRARRRPIAAAATLGVDLVPGEPAPGGGGVSPPGHLYRLQRHDADADRRHSRHVMRGGGLPAGGLEDPPATRFHLAPAASALGAGAHASFSTRSSPVDAIAQGYNVRRILSGDPAPSVQISVHPISAEGVPTLLPLLHCDDEIIRKGVRRCSPRGWRRPKRGRSRRIETAGPPTRWPTATCSTD